MKGAAILVLGGLLAACSGGGTTTLSGNTSAPATPAARDPFEDKINALSDVQRRVTFFRAIYDAEYTCKKIVSIASKPRDANKPVWLVTCDDQGEYLITLQPGGTFTVSGVKQPNTRKPFPKATALPAIDQPGK